MMLSQLRLQASEKMPERHITDGDYTFSHDYSSKGRNKELFGLSILEQFDWFFAWEKNFASKISNQLVLINGLQK